MMREDETYPSPSMPSPKLGTSVACRTSRTSSIARAWMRKDRLLLFIGFFGQGLGVFVVHGAVLVLVDTSPVNFSKVNVNVFVVVMVVEVDVGVTVMVFVRVVAGVVTET